MAFHRPVAVVHVSSGGTVCVSLGFQPKVTIAPKNESRSDDMRLCSQAHAVALRLGSVLMVNPGLASGAITCRNRKTPVASAIPLTEFCIAPHREQSQRAISQPNGLFSSAAREQAGCVFGVRLDRRTEFDFKGFLFIPPAEKYRHSIAGVVRGKDGSQFRNVR